MRMEVEVADEETTRMREASRAACPDAAQILARVRPYTARDDEDTPELAVVATRLRVGLAGAGAEDEQADAIGELVQVRTRQRPWPARCPATPSATLMLSDGFRLESDVSNGEQGRTIRSRQARWTRWRRTRAHRRRTWI